jgi:hypothetical protein
MRSLQSPRFPDPSPVLWQMRYSNRMTKPKMTHNMPKDKSKVVFFMVVVPRLRLVSIQARRVRMISTKGK